GSLSSDLDHIRKESQALQGSMAGRESPGDASAPRLIVEVQTLGGDPSFTEEEIKAKTRAALDRARRLSPLARPFPIMAASNAEVSERLAAVFTHHPDARIDSLIVDSHGRPGAIDGASRFVLNLKDERAIQRIFG